MEKASRLKSPELLPLRPEERDLSMVDFTLLWAGMTINIAAFSVGAQLYPGLAPVKILYAILVAYLLVTLLLVLNGDIGLKYGVPFSVYMRACFGYRGAVIPGILRSIPCFFWFGFQTWVGALALNTIVKMSLGYSNLTVMILFFGAIQILNASHGLKAMAKFDWLAIPMLAVVFGVIFMWLLETNDATIVDVLAAPAENTYSFSFAVMGISGGWITMALNSPDLTRKLRCKNLEGGFWKRNKNSIIGPLVGLVLMGGFVLLVGMTSGILTGTWNPVDVVIKTFDSSNTPALIIAFLTIAFAQWSTNTAGQSYANRIHTDKHPAQIEFCQGRGDLWRDRNIDHALEIWGLSG